MKTASKVMVVLVSGATVAFALAYVALTVAGYKPVAVYSGSMEPRIPVGGLAVDLGREPCDRRVRRALQHLEP